MSAMNTITRTLSASGVSTGIKVNGPSRQGTYANSLLAPGILVSLSSGASLTYQIEVTGDNIYGPGYNPATGNWVPFTGMAGLTASAANTLGAAVAAIRVNVTAYTSGTLTFQFVQVTE